MRLYYGGLALTEQEVDAVLADPRVGQSANEKDDLTTLRFAMRVCEAVRSLSSQPLYIAWLSVGKGVNWQVLADGNLYDVLYGDTLAQAGPPARVLASMAEVAA